MKQGLTQRAAARLLGVSVSFLRASSCPRLEIPGNGPRRKPLVRYFREDVLVWARRVVTQEAPQGAKAGLGASSGQDGISLRESLENTVKNSVKTGLKTGGGPL
jgi:hypothetical protein